MPKCIQHSDTAALYRCDGCEKNLCEECIDESHILLLCRLCGERALPLAAEQPATTHAVHRKKLKEASADYSFQDALLYPVRGSGMLIFWITVVITGIVWTLPGMRIPSLIMLVMIAALQMRIVRKTVEGRNELPDWPDFMNTSELIADCVVWNVINIVQMVPLVFLYWHFMAGEGIDFGYSLLLALIVWIGNAFAVMAYGAAGNYARIFSLFIHKHVKGFLLTGIYGVQVTSFIFVLALFVLFLESWMESNIFLLGLIMSHVVAIYWMFILPHLSGLLFRKYEKEMDQLYFPYGPEA